MENKGCRAVSFDPELRISTIIPYKPRKAFTKHHTRDELPQPGH